MDNKLAPDRILTAVVLLLLLLGGAALLLSSQSSGPSATHEFTPPRPQQPAALAHTPPLAYVLTTAMIARYAVVLKPAHAFSKPSGTSRVVTTLPTMTADGTQNIVLVLGAVMIGSHVWYRVRLAILPNNSIGWVPGSALGTLYSVTTHLYVNLASQTATLKRKGVVIFRTRIGVGRPTSPTPRGQFYVRDKLTGFHDAFYGPVAFGTSARSAVLTDWINGGYIGVHGTNEPRILPGRVSHGCVRMANASILALARLMPVGTPVTVA
jgi:L,D-transpeptidase-like protein